MEGWFRTAQELIHIDLKINPGAPQSRIAGVKNNRLYVRIAAPPEDGKANDCLCEFFAKALGCAKRDISLIKGEKSRLKTITVPASCGERLKEIGLAR